MDKWDIRRRNLKVLIAVRDTNPTQLAKDAGLSVNSITKFLRKETKALRGDTLDKICAALGLNSPTILDSDNPFSDAKNKLYEVVDAMSEQEAQVVLDQIQANRTS